MSSENMRKLIESVNTAQRITEGYDDRVNDVVAIIQRNHPDGITKKEFPQAVEQAGEEAGAIEMRKSVAARQGGSAVGDSRKDFIKDVAAKIEFKRDTSKADSKRSRQAKALEELAYIIDEAIGNSFPDGDPIDAIIPRARRLGIPLDSLAEWLDRAVKKHLGEKGGYHDYVAMMWDHHDETVSTMPHYDSQSNPWR